MPGPCGYERNFKRDFSRLTFAFKCLMRGLWARQDWHILDVLGNAVTTVAEYARARWGVSDAAAVGEKVIEGVLGEEKERGGDLAI